MRYKALTYRASKLIYQRYGMNFFELDMLCALTTCLIIHNKRVMSRLTICRWLGFGMRREKKSFGYFQGLSRLGAIHVLTWRNQKPGTGNSIALTPFGAKVLTDYWNELARLEGIEQNHHHNDYQGITAVESPEGYTPTQLGRVA